MTTSSSNQLIGLSIVLYIAVSLMAMGYMGYKMYNLNTQNVEFENKVKEIHKFSYDDGYTKGAMDAHDKKLPKSVSDDLGKPITKEQLKDFDNFLK